GRRPEAAVPGRERGQAFSQEGKFEGGPGADLVARRDAVGLALRGVEHGPGGEELLAAVDEVARVQRHPEGASPDGADQIEEGAGSLSVGGERAGPGKEDRPRVCSGGKVAALHREPGAKEGEVPEGLDVRRRERRT